jgi:hypothetical protein
MAIETGPPDETYDDNVEYLIDTLPGFMANDETSGNWHLLAPIGNEIDKLEIDIKSVDRSASVQEADTIEQLEKLAKMVGISHNAGESKEHFRARIFAKYQLNTSEGTLGDLLQSVSIILNTDIENITFAESTQDATIELYVPKKKVDQASLTSSELADILNELIAAGYEVFGRTTGTLLYVTPSTYNNTSNWSLYDGYDGLDTNDDPKGNGGTYAGILN